MPNTGDNAQYNLERLIALRHYLHARPELSRKETETASYIKNYLQADCPPDEMIDLARSGFAAVYNGEKQGKTILIRTELDALPIQELNDHLPYKSIHDGIGHQCGHDGHIAIVTGLAEIYAQQRPEKGRIVLLYQPDEETGTGARECADHPDFMTHLAPDYAFALHNFPSFPKGQIICKTGTFTSAVKFVAVKLTGAETHSAMPENGSSPAFAIADITQASQEIQKQFGTSEEYALIVPIYYNMGVSSSGVAPGYGEAHYTLRTCRNDVVDNMWEAFVEKIHAIATKYNLTADFEILEEFAANYHEGDVVDMIQTAAHTSGLDYHNLDLPFRCGEDFGEITKRYKGGMFGIGSGEKAPDLHTPDYNFPDDIIPDAIAMFQNLIEQALGYEESETESRVA